MKDFRLHLIVLILIVVAEKIGNISFKVGVGTIVLLPMMYALLMGVATAPSSPRFPLRRMSKQPALCWV